MTSGHEPQINCELPDLEDLFTELLAGDYTPAADEAAVLEHSIRRALRPDAGISAFSSVAPSRQ
jgi:hypothetical protein